MPVVHTPSEVFQGADPCAIISLVSKMAVDRTISNSLSNARESLANSVADALSAYSSTVGIVGHYGKILMSPPNLRLFPLYMCGLLRAKAFRSGVPTRIDDRSYMLERFKSAPVCELMSLIYPKLYALHNFVSKPLSSAQTLVQKAATLTLFDSAPTGHLPSHGIERPSDCDGTSSSSSESQCGQDDSMHELPGQLNLTGQSVNSSGVYLLDNGELLLILVGCGEDTLMSNSSNKSDILYQLLNIYRPDELPVEGQVFDLSFLSSSNSLTTATIARRRLIALISLLRLHRTMNNVVICMRHDASSYLKSIFLSSLVEDRTEYAPSYQEFLQMIQNLMGN